MSNITLERALAKHAGILPSQLRQLSDNKYFIDVPSPIEPLRDNRYNFTIEFAQNLIGNIASVIPT